MIVLRPPVLQSWSHLRERGRKREKEREGERERKRDREREKGSFSAHEGRYDVAKRDRGDESREREQT